MDSKMITQKHSNQNGDLEERYEKLLDHLDDGKAVTYFVLSNTSPKFYVCGQRGKPRRLMLSFYSSDGEFHFDYDEKHNRFDTSEGCLEIIRESEHLVIKSPQGNIFSYGYRRNNSLDFALLYHWEAGEIYGFYILDPLEELYFETHGNSAEGIDFPSLYTFIKKHAHFSFMNTRDSSLEETMEERKYESGF